MSDVVSADAERVVRDKLAQLKLEFGFDSLPYRLDKMFPKIEGWGAKGCLLYTSDAADE